ncbi:hypothetical protein [Janibacter indicus]|uniref:hypothetical protein n=1 Tax=Janibacter indicus TaxID=857417 RepID=UPI001F40393B|nr:hypothetical protein [Janibacter indicus]
MEPWDQRAARSVDDSGLCRAGDEPRFHGDDVAVLDDHVGAYAVDLDVVEEEVGGRL